MSAQPTKPTELTSATGDLLCRTMFNRLHNLNFILNIIQSIWQKCIFTHITPCETGDNLGEKNVETFLSTLPRSSSIDSDCSFFSLIRSQKAESFSDLSTTVCKCDDCLLGITDALADLVLWKSSNTNAFKTVDEHSSSTE